jgi:hypothetical protein
MEAAFSVPLGHHAVGAMYALHCWLAQNPDKMPSNQPLHPDASRASALSAGERQPPPRGGMTRR